MCITCIGLCLEREAHYQRLPSLGGIQEKTIRKKEECSRILLGLLLLCAFKVCVFLLIVNMIVAAVTVFDFCGNIVVHFFLCITESFPPWRQFR